MKLKQIRIKNFLSIEDATIDLDKRGIVLIDGVNNTPASAIDTNGTGKSSMLSAIYYAIYGESPNGEKADALINRNFGKGLLVEVDFEVEGQQYTLSRGRKKNLLTLVAGETDLTKGTMKETQTVIDELVNIRKDVYLSTIYFDGHNSIPFSMLTDKQRKDYLEILFDVGIYKQAYEQTKADITDIKNEITLAKGNVTNEERLIESETSSLNQFEALRNKSLEELPTLEERKEVDRVAYDNKALEVAKVKRNADEAKKQLQANLEPYDNSKYNKIDKELTLAKRSLGDINQKNTYNKALIQSLAGKIRSLSESDLCIVCGNPIDEEHKQKEIASLTQELKPIVETYKEGVASIPSLEEAVSTLQDELQEEYELRDKYTKEQSGVYNAISQIDIKVQEANKEELGYSSTYLNSKSAYEQALSYSTTYDDSIKQYKTKLGTRRLTLETLNAKLLDKVNEQIKLEQALTAFSDKGIKSHVLDFVTPELNTRISNYLNFLTGGTITVEFSTQTAKANGEMSDKFDIQVTNNGKQTTYESLSSGEKRRVDIAISLTLQDILISKSNMSTNVLVYDELFESLDAVGAESVVELLKQRLETSSTILVVTHNENLKPLFSETITAVKEKDGNTHILNGEKK